MVMKKVFIWLGIVLGSLVGLVLVAVVVLVFIGNARLNKTYDFPPSNLTIPTDAASISRGQHFAETLCEGCHGADLSGISNWFNAGPLGTVDSANLTSGEGGVGRNFTDEDFVRAIRHGIDPQGKPTFMPAVVSTSHLSDEDLSAVIAYVKSVPPVDHVTTGKHFKPLAKIMLALGMIGKLPAEAVSHEVHVSAPSPGVTTDYGAYLVNTHDCHVCHGPNMNGGKFPDPTIKIITPNLTPGGDLNAWTEDQFINTIRTGTTPHGHNLNPDLMPWKDFKNMTDDELKAIWAYLNSIPAMDQYTP
jgi:mono/diheme cytochrome c family protein